MPISVRSLYSQVCDSLLEPGGLTGETVTDEQFLQILNQCLSEFLQLGPYVKPLINPTELGVRIYESPGPATVIKNLAVDETGITMNSGFYWDQSDASWQNNGPGTPQEFRQDQLDNQQFEVRPSPAWNGWQLETSGIGLYGQISTTSNLASDFNIEADERQSQGLLGTISECDYGNVYADPATIFFGVVSGMEVSDLNITQFSILDQTQPIESLGEYIQDISDLFVPYLRLNIMRQIANTNSESKSTNASKYLSARCEEGVAIIKSITDEKQD